jgi:aryl-alcohol dehydrogenase-like predicted oxidoreductase
MVSSFPGAAAMVYRAFGSTGLDVSEISLGMEHLDREDPASLVDTVRAAVEEGVNFLDLTVFKPEARDRMGDALTGSSRSFGTRER